MPTKPTTDAMRAKVASAQAVLGSKDKTFPAAMTGAAKRPPVSLGGQKIAFDALPPELQKAILDDEALRGALPESNGKSNRAPVSLGGQKIAFDNLPPELQEAIQDDEIARQKPPQLPLQPQQPPAPPQLPANVSAPRNEFTGLFDDVDLSSMGSGVPGESPRPKGTMLRPMPTATAIAPAKALSAPPQLPTNVAPASSSANKCPLCGDLGQSPFCPVCGRVGAAPKPSGPPQINPAKLAAHNAQFPVATFQSDAYGPEQPPGDPGEDYERRATRDEMKLARKPPPQMPGNVIAPEPTGGAQRKPLVSGGAAVTPGGKKPPQLPASIPANAKGEEDEQQRQSRPFSGGAGNADWIAPAIGLLSDLTQRSGKKPAQLPSMGGLGGASDGASGAGASSGDNQTMKELLAAIKELTVAVKANTAATDKLTRGAGGGKQGGTSMPVQGGNPQATFDQLKRAVADSGNQMLGRQGGSTVARSGPAVPGGAAQGAGVTPGAVQPAATGAQAAGRRN